VDAVIAGMAVESEYGAWQLFLMPNVSPQQVLVSGVASISVRVTPKTPSTTKVDEATWVTATEWL
jgi:hypothetical protein